MRRFARAIAFLLIPIGVFIGLTIARPSGIQYSLSQERGTVIEGANSPIQYIGAPSCQSCHQAEFAAWDKSPHKTVTCESCHGPAQAHLQGTSSPITDTSPELCALCHSQLFSRPEDFPQINVEEHAGQAKCVTCHNPHSPAVASVPRIPHTLEGRSDCLLCHGAGGFKPFPQDHQGRTADSCSNCHKTAT